MTEGGGRPGRRRVLSWLLALVLLAVLGVVVFRDNQADPVELVVVTGVIGSEKAPFFADPQVREVFRANGLDVRVDPAGSRQIATTTQLDHYDFAFPSSAPAADKLLAAHPTPRTYSPFSSPMAVATFAPIVDVLTTAGVVAPGSQTFDMHRYLQLAAANTRWDQLPGNKAFPAHKNVLLSTTGPCQSNSAAMYVGIASYSANGDNVVATPAGAATVVPALEPLFRDQGYLPPSSERLFEDYLTGGMGRVPMAMVYEAQYVATELQPNSVLPADARLLYPSPTVFSRHTLVPLRPVGERVGELLTTDPDLIAIATRYGFRTDDPKALTAAVTAHGLAAPPALVDVVEPPNYDALEGLLTSLGCPK